MSHTWDHPNADPMTDLRNMVWLMSERGLPAVRQIHLPGPVIDAHGGIDSVQRQISIALNTEVTVRRLGEPV